jgi:hypothetical protein
MPDNQPHDQMNCLSRLVEAKKTNGIAASRPHDQRDRENRFITQALDLSQPVWSGLSAATVGFPEGGPSRFEICLSGEEKYCAAGCRPIGERLLRFARSSSRG